MGQYESFSKLSLMGCDFEIRVIANEEKDGEQAIDVAVAEIKRIEHLISSWDSNSQTSLINRNAGIKPVVVDPELISLITRAVTISRLTDGAFDITYASMDRVWKFDGSMKNIPSADAIQNSVSKIGYEKVIIDAANNTVFLRDKGMKIGFGAIGKGYSADRAKELLLDLGIISGIINASGDMTTWGRQLNGEPWNVGIINPLNKQKVFAILPVENRSVVTSGSYEKFITLDGKQYSHIIDPRTGYPSTGLVSVTVFAPNTELADALATSVFVMGTEVGIDRINQLNNVECLIIDERGKIHQSKQIELSYDEN